MKETAERTAAPAPVAIPDPAAVPRIALQEVTTAEHVLAMQRTSGNQSVVRFLARDPAPQAAPTRPSPRWTPWRA